MKQFAYMIFLFFALAGSALAGYTNEVIPGWDKLDDEQKAEIRLEAAKAAKAKAIGPVTPADIQEWIKVGKSIGVGFGAAAKELGMGVDTLMKSDTGKIAMFLIVWNYIGDQMLGVVGGILWFAVMLPGWAVYTKRVAFDSEIIKVNGKEKIKYSLTDGDRMITMLVVLVAISIAGFIMIFS